MIQKVPEFIETLMPVQQRILYAVMQKNLPLKYFFISIHEK